MMWWIGLLLSAFAWQALALFLYAFVPRKHEDRVEEVPIVALVGFTLGGIMWVFLSYVRGWQ